MRIISSRMASLASGRANACEVRAAAEGEVWPRLHGGALTEVHARHGELRARMVAGCKGLHMDATSVGQAAAAHSWRPPLWGAARCAPRSQGRCNRAVASSQLAEACTRTPPRQIKRITTLPRCSPVVWPCGLIGQKMHDAIAERALQHLSGPTRPWRAPGTHVEAGGSSPGGHVGGAVSHSILVVVNF